MNDAPILVFQDSSQYDVLAGFARELGHGLSALGRTVRYLDFRAVAAPYVFQTIQRMKPSHIIAFNAIGYDLAHQGRSLYDQVDVTFVAWLVDHPMYHLPRLNHAITNRVIVCVDPSHVAFLNHYYNGREKALFLPHGASPLPPECLLLPQRARSREILFAGTYYDPRKTGARLQSLPPESAPFINTLLEQLLGQEHPSLTEIAWRLLSSGPLSPEKCRQTYTHLIPVLLWVDQHHIALKRERLLQHLAADGLPLTLIGHHWEDAPYAGQANVRLLPALSSDEMQARMRQAPLLLNMTPSFPGGSHERVFQALQTETVCATHSGLYLQRHFQPDELVFYSWQEPEIMSGRLKELLDSPEEREKIASHAARKAAEHTWKARAQDLLALLGVGTDARSG